MLLKVQILNEAFNLNVNCAIFEVLPAGPKRITVFWDMTPYHVLKLT
jgi:hypothetical protein